MQASERGAAMRPGLAGSLAFPLRRDVLGAMAAYAVAGLVPHVLAGTLTVQWLPAFSISGPVLGSPIFVAALVLDGVLALFGLKLAVEAMLDAAHDRHGEIGAGGHPATDTQAGRQFGLFALLAVVAYLAALLAGPAAAWALLVVAAPILPAMIVLVALEDSLLRAFHPGVLAALLSRLGSTYVGVAAAVVLCAAAAIALQAVLHALLPGLVATVPARFVGLYALVAAYHAIGKGLYRRHERLGLDVAPVIAAPRHASHEEDEVVAAAEARAAAGDPAAAAELLRALLRRRGASAPVHAFYRTLLLELGDLPGLAAHAREYVATLLALGDDKHALALVADARRLDPAFALDDPESITRLVAYADTAGHSAAAVQLAEGFGERFPKSGDIVRNGLVAARLLAQRLGREAEARQLLVMLVARYRDDPLAGEARAALESLR